MVIDHILLIYLKIYFSKFDLQNCDGAVSVPVLTEALGLHKLCLGRSWHLQPCNAQSGTGLHEGLDWLAVQLVPSDILNSV